MAGINKVILIGNLGKDPELRFTPGGQAVVNFTLATKRSWMDKEGQRQEKTEWHRIVVWGKLAELCSNYLSKGRQAYLEGELQTREWQDKDGNKRYTTEIVANQVQFLGSRTDGATSAPSAVKTGMTPSDVAGVATNNSGFEPSNFDYGPAPSDDDVPF